MVVWQWPECVIFEAVDCLVMDVAWGAGQVAEEWCRVGGKVEGMQLWS